MLEVLLMLLMVVATIYDFKYRRIPNWLIMIGLGAFLGCHFWLNGLAGVWFSLKGLIMGMALLIIPFAMRGIGAGDVKLLGMVGACQGALFAASTFLWMALWGGLMAGFILHRRGRLKQTIGGLGLGGKYAILSFTGVTTEAEQSPDRIYYPYALAIALGVLCSLMKGWF